MHLQAKVPMKGKWIKSLPIATSRHPPSLASQSERLVKEACNIKLKAS